MPPSTTIVYHPAHGPGRRAPAAAAVPIGEVTPDGKVLDKTAFAQLSAADRLRAYLLMVWPASRPSRLLERVCGTSARSVSTLLRADLRAGEVQRTAQGLYRATPDTPPAHVRRATTQEGDPACTP